MNIREKMENILPKIPKKLTEEQYKKLTKNGPQDNQTQETQDYIFKNTVR
jgi:hypothetical protein